MGNNHADSSIDMIQLLALLVVAALSSPASSFVVAGSQPSIVTTLGATVSTEEDLLKPSYEIEPISIRIGHGFDIHRMAPIGEAGQPVVIGGVEITHKDQKVSIFGDCSFCLDCVVHPFWAENVADAFGYNRFRSSGPMPKESTLKRGEPMRRNLELLPIRMGTLYTIQLLMLFLVL